MSEIDEMFKDNEKIIIDTLKQIRNSLYVEENFYEWQVAIDKILDLYNKEKEKNKQLFEEYNKRVATIIKYEQEIKEIIDKIDVEDYYCLNEAEEDLRKLVE